MLKLELRVLTSKACVTPVGFQRQFVVYLLCECHHVSGEKLCEFHCDIPPHPGVGGGITQGQPKSYAHLWLQNKGDISPCVRLSTPSFQSLMASPSHVSCFPLGSEKIRCPPPPVHFSPCSWSLFSTRVPLAVTQASVFVCCTFSV